MNCEKVREYLLPFIDHELNSRLSSEIETHLHSCLLCSQEFESEKRIESAIKEKMVRDQAPLVLRQQLIRQIDRQKPRSSLWWVLLSLFQYRPRRVLASVAILAVIIGSFYVYRTVRTPYFPIFQEALNNHTNFLAGGFSLEITSSQAEEVSSWFQEKVDFSVPVPEFPAEEIELLGGRLIRIKDQDVVFLFYRSEEHNISFLIHDCTEVRLPRARSMEAQGRHFDVFASEGYNVVHLEDHQGTPCTIVSDMDLQLLLELLSRVRPSLV